MPISIYFHGAINISLLFKWVRKRSGEAVILNFYHFCYCYISKIVINLSNNHYLDHYDLINHQTHVISLVTIVSSLTYVRFNISTKLSFVISVSSQNKFSTISLASTVRIKSSYCRLANIINYARKLHGQWLTVTLQI